MKRMKIKTEHAGPKNGGGWWGSRAEAKDLSRLLRRRNDKALIEQEVIEMCSRDDDPTQHDRFDPDGIEFCPGCDGPTTKPDTLCWYCDDEPDADEGPDIDNPYEQATLAADPYLAALLDAVLAADRDDPHIDYASEV